MSGKRPDVLQRIRRGLFRWMTFDTHDAAITNVAQ
jgi:hypothetical protein